MPLLSRIMDMVTARHSLPRVTTTMPNTIKLRSSDDETFEVDEDVALCVSTRIDDDDANDAWNLMCLTRALALTD